MSNKVNYVIKTYNSDPKIDFNKAQADIYNSVVKKYTGNTVTAEEIQYRTEHDKFDYNGMMFAFTFDNKPLAYIRYYLYPSGSLYIGYPWAIADCPAEIQPKLFSDLKNYLKKKFPERSYARMGFADNRIVPFHEFANMNHLERDLWEDEYYIDVEKFNPLDIRDYSYREAVLSDIDQMVALALEDFEFYGQEERLNAKQTKNYLQEDVFTFGNCVLLLKEDLIIGFVCPLRNKKWNNSLFTFIKCESLKKEYQNQRFLLYVILSKLLYEKGLVDEKIFCSKSSKEKILIQYLENSPAEKKEGTSSYKVPL